MVLFIRTVLLDIITKQKMFVLCPEYSLVALNNDVDVSDIHFHFFELTLSESRFLKDHFELYEICSDGSDHLITDTSDDNLLKCYNGGHIVIETESVFNYLKSSVKEL